MIRGRLVAPRLFASHLVQCGARSLVLASSLAVLAACSAGESNGVITAESIGLTTSGSADIAVGQSVTLYVHASDVNGTRIPAFSAVTFSSSNPTVASVTKSDTTAVVTGLAAGETVISATVKDGVVAHATVRVGSVPIISVTPGAAVFTAYRNSTVNAQTVAINNAGSGTLTSLAATTTAPWLQVSFVGGNTTANPTASLRLQPSMTGLADGTYSTTVSITSTVSGVAPRSVPVTLQIAPGPVAFKMEAVTSASQGGSAGQPVAQPPTVVVRAADDTPVSGVAVTFSVNGGGSISPSGVVTTNANGIAALTSWTLGSSPGALQTVTASSPGLANSPLTFTATALSASKIAKASGDNQTTVLGRTLPQPVVVRVLDPNDTPVPNATVTFAVSGGGTVSAASGTTGANGLLSVTWTLGTALGNQTLTASLVGPAGSPAVTFGAVATGATSIAKVSGDAQSASAGAELTTPLRVRVTGANNEPVINETVTFAPAGNSGSVNPTTAKTDANGEATARWTMPTTTGAKTLVASINPPSGAVNVAFSATATQPPPSGITIVSGDGQSGRVGGPLPQQIVVRVVTTVGSGIPNAAVTFTPVSGSGQSFSPSSATTDANGEVRATWTIGSAFGSYTATVASPGLPSRTITATGSLPPVGSGMFTGGASKVPSGTLGASDQAVMRYAGPASGEVPLDGSGGFSTPQVPAGTYTITIASSSGAFPSTSVYGASAVSGQITSLGTIPVAYAGQGTLSLAGHACSNIGDANGTATVEFFAGVNGDQGGSLAYSWTIPFNTEELETAVAYGIYTMRVTAHHNTDPNKKCAVYRAIVQHSSPLTAGHTSVPVITLTNP
ncbi:MAG TPA: Ig-like domain-containing protein [Gemmatimonadaceae bacterium]|nr:Ig-like domain-containing protein [Gemmatimonadaceae bacterium]